MFAARQICYDFRGAQAPPLTASRDGGPWTKADTSAAGSPTVQTGSGGAMELTLTNTNEVQNLCLYNGDVLPFDIDDLIRVEILAKVTASLASTVTAVVGLASARNDDPAAIANHLLFKVAGNNNLTIDTDDGTTDLSVATGETLSSTYKRLVIDFASGVTTKAPPAVSLGGKSNVHFHVSNSNGVLRRVARNTAFDLSAYAGHLQLYAQLQKSAATDVATLSILEFLVDYRVPA